MWYAVQGMDPRSRGFLLAGMLLLLALGNALRVQSGQEAERLTLHPLAVPFAINGEQRDAATLITDVVDLTEICLPCGGEILGPTQYVVWIPRSAVGLRLSLSCVTPPGLDLDLFVRASVPVMEDADNIYFSYASQGPGGEEALWIQPSDWPGLTSGLYYVAVSGVPGYRAEYTLSGEIVLAEAPASPQELDAAAPASLTERYADSTMGFAINYPGNWRPPEESAEASTAVVFTPLDCGDHGACPSLEVAWFPHEGDELLDAILGRMIDSIESELGYRAVAVRELALNDIPARGAWLQCSVPRPMNLMFALLVHQERLWIVKYLFPFTPLFDVYSEAFDAFLDSWEID